VEERSSMAGIVTLSGRKRSANQGGCAGDTHFFDGVL
jgi:hypothetical protein